MGRYTAECASGALTARFVRAPVAHADIVRLDLAAARALPGVVAAFAMADLDGVLPGTALPLDQIANLDGSVTPVPPRPALARQRVRFAGEALALVVAVSEAAAADGVEAAAVAYDEHAATTTLNVWDSAGRAGVALHEGVPGNIGFDWHGGDAAAVSGAFAAAAHVISMRVILPRILGLPLEPASAVASYAEGRWTLVTPSQGAHAIRRELTAGYLRVDAERLRVVTPDVGGAFGIRIHALPEHAVLLGAARLLGRPVAWRADRSESNLCEPHARDMQVDAELALDRDGCFLGLRGSALCSLGAYVHPGARATPTASLLFGLQGAYRMPAISLRVQGLYTNTTPTGPFRGAGQPEGTYVLERLIDRAAAELGLAPASLRARNALGPADFPYRTATGHLVDGGDAQAALHQAVGWLAAQPRAPAPALHGTGMALYMKVNGMGRQERAEVAACAGISPGTGQVEVRIGSQCNGQGHATTFAALAAARLGLPLGQVTVVQGDTDRVAFGTGTGASSALGTTGTGVQRSSVDLLRAARAAAAQYLNTPEDALDYTAGSFRVTDGNRFVTLQQLAAEGELVGRSEVPVSLTYTIGCHACTVGVDTETGTVRLLGYAAFDDLGPLLQSALAQGQLHGGIAQGVGQALLEAMHYDEAAQPVAASLLDYGLPRASDLPDFLCVTAQTPSAATDLGTRGAGEAGAVASMAALANAVAQAVGGTALLDAPLTPQRVWEALQAGRDAAPAQPPGHLRNEAEAPRPTRSCADA